MQEARQRLPLIQEPGQALAKRQPLSWDMFQKFSELYIMNFLKLPQGLLSLSTLFQVIKYIYKNFVHPCWKAKRSFLSYQVYQVACAPDFVQIFLELCQRRSHAIFFTEH